jgi:TRAP-type C4-dicarboxylate transport system substrate-binding protein
MTVLRKTVFAFVVLAMMLGMSTAAMAQKTTVLRVVIVKTDNPAAYAQALEAGKEIMKKLGLSVQVHVYQASYAGPETGSVAASIEFASMQALADGEAKLRADKDYQAWIKSLDKLRTIVSDSIYREL